MPRLLPSLDARARSHVSRSHARSPLRAGLAALTLLAGGAYADVIVTGPIDPEWLETLLASEDGASGPLRIGPIEGGPYASVVIDSNNVINGVSSVVSVSLEIGRYEGSGGLLRVVGNGQEGSASFVTNLVRVGGMGDEAVLEVLDGGYMRAHFLDTSHPLMQSSGSSVIRVDGLGSRLEVEQLHVYAGADRRTELSVAGGAELSISGGPARALELLATDGGVAVIHATGHSSVISLQDRLELSANEGGSVSARIEDGATLQAAWKESLAFGDGFIGSLFSGWDIVQIKDSAELIVSGAGSQLVLGAQEWPERLAHIGIAGTDAAGVMRVEAGAHAQAGGEVHVGRLTGPLGLSFTYGQGELLVRDDATLTAHQVVVHSNSWLGGDGGTIVAPVYLEGGTLAPGDSIGGMTIDGDLIMNSGVLQLEVGPEGQDWLEVSGSVHFGDDLLVHIILNGLAADDWVLDLGSFFTTGGGMTFGEGFSLENNVRVSEVPLPAAGWLFLSALAGLGWMRRVR